MKRITIRTLISIVWLSQVCGFNPATFLGTPHLKPLSSSHLSLTPAVCHRPTRSSSNFCLFSTSAPEKPVTYVADDDEDEDEDEDEHDYEYYEDEEYTDDQETGEEDGDDGDEGEEKFADETNKHQEEEFDEIEMLAAIDETPVGELSSDQVLFIRDIMSYFVQESEENDDTSEVESSAPVVERLLFRLLDEWHDLLESDAGGEQDRVALLEPTLEDFTLTMRAWKKDAMRYSISRRKDPRGQQAVDRIKNLLEILDELWQEGQMVSLKPNQEILEMVLSVLASSRERGMDRRVGSLFESVSNLYGLEPTCDMYQSLVLSQARSKDKGSSQRAERFLKQAVEKFPPGLDPVSGLAKGVPIESFNKVLVSWAKSGLEYGPERAEKLIVYMDDLDRKAGGGGGTVKPNLSSFTTLIDAYAQQNDWDSVSQCERIFNRLLDHYFEGEVQEEPNIASWTIVISAWSRLAKKGRRGAEQRADKLLKRMESLYQNDRLSFGPDAIAYTACMNAWAFSKNAIGPTQAELILDEMHEKYMDGDDSMRPSTRSIQIIIDSWSKMGTEEAMEQAELLLDRYEDHIESVASPDNGPSEKAPDEIADIYRSMLFGWSKCDPERAQEYLLDMVDRKMKLDSFSFDKIIEAETQRLSDDPSAIKRIREVFDVMEQCRQTGEVQPNERVFTSFIRAITRAHEKDLAEKACEVLQRMDDLYEEGNKGIRPTVFTYNAVLNACAETMHIEDAKPMEAFKRALGIFNMLRTRREALDHVSYGNMIKCANLLPDGSQKDKFIVTTFKLCCERGMVNSFIIRDLQNAASEELWRGVLHCPHGEVDIDTLPSKWSFAINAKNNRREGFDERKSWSKRR